MRITSLNLWALARHFDGRDETPNGTIEATSAPHLRRCMKAGLLEVHGGRKGTLRLTDAGRERLIAEGLRPTTCETCDNPADGEEPDGLCGDCRWEQHCRSCAGTGMEHYVPHQGTLACDPGRVEERPCPACDGKGWTL